MILGIGEWVKFAEGVLHRFVRKVASGGYSAEHYGPTMSYDYLNGSVAGYLLPPKHDPLTAYPKVTYLFYAFSV